MPEQPGTAACTGMGPSIFYPALNGGHEVLDAIDICLTCPVRARCLWGALQRAEGHGIWGATSARERVRIRRDRGRMAIARAAAHVEEEET